MATKASVSKASVSDMSEIDYLLQVRDSLSEKTKSNYVNYYKRLRPLLDKDIKNTSESKLIDTIDTAEELDKKTNELKSIPPSVKLSLLNVAIVIRQIYNESIEDLVKYRTKGKKTLNEATIIKNVDLKEKLPTLKELVEYTNKLFSEGKYKNYILNYLILAFNVRNMDLNLTITRNAEQVNNKDNWIVLRKDTARYLRYVFKTATKYDCKENIISSKKVIEALKILLGENESVNLLATQDGERVADSSLNKVISRATYNGIGQGNYLKVLLGNKTTMKTFEKVSANRGTSIAELNTYYDTNFTNEQGKMENVMKKSKCLSKIPQSEMGNVKLEQKKKQKEEEYKNAKKTH